MSVAVVPDERSPKLLLIGCSVVFAALALVQARSDGLTYDEGFYVTSGLHALVHHDLRVVPEAPPLSHVIAAAPVLLLHPAVPRGASWRRADRRAMTADLLHAQGGGGRLHRKGDLFGLVRRARRTFGSGDIWCPRPDHPCDGAWVSSDQDTSVGVLASSEAGRSLRTCSP